MEIILFRRIIEEENIVLFLIVERHFIIHQRESGEYFIIYNSRGASTTGFCIHRR